jgi:hypothetical protein
MQKARRLFYIILLLTVSVLLYLCFKGVSRGDEAYGYLYSLEQSFAKWPMVDLSPFWTISSFYLWVVSALHWLGGRIFEGNIIITGRLFSLICWIVMIIVSLNKKDTIRWKLLIILFNPYLLVFATRAHPLIPSILLSYLFWDYAKGSSATLRGILMLLSVNFQVYSGGATAMFLPTTRGDITKPNIIQLIIYVSFAIAGVLITWLTWGGVYPVQFINHDFYSTYHVNGRPSFGYIPAILLLSGGIFYAIGERPLVSVFVKSNYNKFVIIIVLLCCIFLYFTQSIIGTISNITEGYLGNYSKEAWVFLYGMLGIGWIKVHRDHLKLFLGLLGSGILLVALPYFYERITVFATIAPILAWCINCESRDDKVKEWRSLILCVFFLVLAVIYEQYGSL